MSDYIAQLERGKYVLDLNDDISYKIGNDFAPPSTAITPSFAGGTSANIYGGATKATERADNVEWTFTIECLGNSEAEAKINVRDLVGFVSTKGDDILVFAFRGNKDIPQEPVWGQYGGNTRFEIAHANTPIVGQRYSLAETRKFGITVTFTVNVKPFGLGKQQRLASATGGVLENVIGSKTGFSKGLQVPEATTNKMTNPVFGHSTWDTSWTAQAGITESENKNKKFIIWGNSSAKLTATGASSRTFVQSINVGNTNTHMITAYVKMPDGSDVSSSNVQLIYGAASITETYQSIGDGWYIVSGSVTGVASATDTGVEVVEDYTVYLAGMQIEEKSYYTTLCYGDMLGCSWSGTEHNSASSRTAAGVNIGEQHDIAQGTFRVVWMPDKAHTSFPSNINLIDDATSNMRLIWNSGPDTWTFTDGTNTVTSSADTFAAYDIVVLHMTYSPTGLNLYKNGSSIATGNSYSPSTLGDLYIGSSSIPSIHANGTFLDVTIWNEEITSAEVLADYNNITQILDGTRSLSPIPWLWTKDGDDQVDNCLDSTRHNYCVTGGIGGDSPASTLIVGSASTDFGQIGKVYISNLALSKFYDPASLVFYDQSGTVVANTCGGEVKRTSLATTENSLMVIETVTESEGIQELYGKKYVPVFRILDNGSNLQVKTRYTLGSNVESKFKPVAVPTSFRLFRSKELVLMTEESVLGNFLFDKPAISFYLRGIRSSGGASNVDVDYVCLMFWPYCVISNDTNSTLGFAINERQAVGHTSGVSAYDLFRINDLAMGYDGASIDLIPNKTNTTYFLMGDESNDATITYTLDLIIEVIPRWRIF